MASRSGGVVRTNLDRRLSNQVQVHHHPPARGTGTCRCGGEVPQQDFQAWVPALHQLPIVEEAEMRR